MNLIPSNAHLAVFSAGTIIGATSALILLKCRFFRSKKVPLEERFEFSDTRDEYRLVMAIRNDLKMQKGKVAAQCGHAAVAAYAKALKLAPKTLQKWMNYGGTKITVRIESEEEMNQLQEEARKVNVLTSIIRDAGQTQVAPGSRTVMAIGPAPKTVLDKITGHLKLY